MATGRPRLTPTFGLTGAVLCGGASRRMGTDKATMLIGGTAMAVRVADALRAAGATEVYAVGGAADPLRALGLDVVHDEWPGEGPLPATLTALRRAHAPMIAVLSCDLVAPSATAVRVLVTALHAADPAVMGAVPVVEGHHQWTHAVWRTDALAALDAARAAGARSLHQGAAAIPIVAVHDLDPRLLADADTREDLAGPATGAINGEG